MSGVLVVALDVVSIETGLVIPVGGEPYFPLGVEKSVNNILLSLFPNCRMLLLCRVTLGKPVEQFSSTRIAHAPPGHHSVIGRPSVGGLAYPEYVIYRGEQV